MIRLLARTSLTCLCLTTASAVSSPATADQPAQTGGERPATTAPQPPLVAAEGDSPVTSGEDEEPPSRPAASAEADLLNQVADALAAAGTEMAGMRGEEEPLRVLEWSQSVPLARDDGQHVAIELRCYTAPDRTRLEMRFSRPINLERLERSGRWYRVEVEGYKLAVDRVVPVGAGELRSLVMKTVDDEFDLRLGLELSDYGEAKFTRADDRRTLVATVYRPTWQQQLVGIVNPTPPFRSAFRVQRTLTGTASWYGAAFHGRRTASGEPFNQNGFTCAHRTLPFGTWLRLTNPDNGRQAVVKVTDRGPFSHGRALDVSSEVARAMGWRHRGTCQLVIEVLELVG